MFVCLSCNSPLPKRKSGYKNKFCNNQCQGDYRVNQKIESWLNGVELGWTGVTKQIKSFVRTYLHKKRGTACEQCGWNDRHPTDGAILTEIDHIDGDAENCSPDNLRILCPNCHSKTPTFRVRNKSSKRVR